MKTFKEERKELAGWLKSQRIEKGISKYKIYKSGNIAKNTVEAIERGDNVLLENIQEYCRILQIKIQFNNNEQQ